jgi:hypothetical protein
MEGRLPLSIRSSKTMSTRRTIRLTTSMTLRRRRRRSLRIL